jgi:hypothetical protein
VATAVLAPALRRALKRAADGTGSATLWNARAWAMAIEVPITMQHRQPAVLSCRGRDQGVGGWNAVVAIVAVGQFTNRSGCRVGDRAVVAQDAQRVKLGLKRYELGAGAG